MKLAYADPPYPRMAKRWYGDHPDYDGEVDHGALIAQLGEYDGWALSTSAQALQEVLALSPAGVRIAVWNRPNSEPPGNRGSWHWSWEPVIVSPARPPAITTRDVLTAPMPGGFLGGTIAGQKPPAFTRWVLSLLGAAPGDEVADIFAGSGAVAAEIARWQTQPTLPTFDSPALFDATVHTAACERKSPGAV